MKHSIKKQLALLFIALMAGLIGSCWLANNILFGKYYVQKKRQALVSAYDLVNAAGNENIMDTDDFQVTLQNTLAKGNMSILVLDQGYHTVISSVNESRYSGHPFAGKYLRLRFQGSGDAGILGSIHIEPDAGRSPEK